MSQCLHTTDGFIKSTFGPRVAVLCSQDAEIISKRNNLSFAELIRPFCSINNEIHVRDPMNQVFTIHDLRITVCDVRSSQPDENMVKQMLSDAITDATAEAESSQTMNIQCNNYSISINVACPWFDAYREMLMSTAPPMQHEFISYCTSCLLVVSSLHPNPIEEFANLSKHQNHLQHNAKGETNLRWMTPNTLKYYVLLHDVSQADEQKAKKVLADLQSMYGNNACYLLKINSKVSTDYQNIPDPWSRFLNRKSKQNPSSNGIDIGPNLSPPNDLNIETSTVVHPDDQKWMKDLKHTVPTQESGYGCCLTLADHDNLRNFLFDFASHGLIPHMEKTIRNFSEQIASRKGIHRSLFRATKTFFGGGKTVSAPALKSYGMGSSESPELQVRKIADLYFLCQMYENAYQHYHAAKKDFSNDQAWLHAAGASEMAALSNFMQTRSQRAYPSHYVESAIDTYSVTCSNDYLSLRCALVSLECLRQRGMYSEAASQLLKLVNEADDLKSAILLEQIAQCFLRTQRPLVRKFAFHIVLAGHRYGKALQRQCALLCYNSALQVYRGSGWRLAEDHINFTIGRQSFNLQQLDIASYSFEHLVKDSQQHPSQQAFFMNEYLHVSSRYKNTTNAIIEHVLPKLHLEQTVARDSPCTVEKNKQFEFLESSVKTVAKSASTQFSEQDGKFECVVHETVWVDICMENPLKIALSITDASLSVEFEPIESLPEADIGWSAVPLEEVILPKQSQKIVSFPIKTYCTGTISVVGIEYKLGIAEISGVPQTNVSSAELEGRQLFFPQKQNLQIKVCAPMPKLEMIFEEFPTKLLNGEIKSTKLTLKNVGQTNMQNVKVACDPSVKCLFTNHNTDFQSCKKHFLLHEQHPTQGVAFVQSIIERQLEAGEQIELTAWFQGTLQSGEQTVNLLFYYEPTKADSDMLYRVIKYSNQISTTPSIDVNTVVLWDNSQSNALVSVNSSNLSKENSTDFTFKCVMSGSDKWCLKQVTKTIPLLKFQQSVKLYFQAVDNSFTPPSTESEKSEIHFTDQKVMDVQSPVQASWTLVSKEQEILQHKENNKLTVALEWSVQNTNQTCTGQHYIDMSELTTDATSAARIGLSENSDLILENNESLAALHKLVRWDLEFKAIQTHDFSKSFLCYLPVTIQIQNLYNCDLSVTVDGLNSNQSQSTTGPIFLWVGKALSQFTLSPKSALTISMTACFPVSGIFNLNTFSVWAVPVHLGNSNPMFPQNCQYPCYATIQDKNSSS
uniref:trafficking protein particle complex subunit 8-like n=1 Tax=Ciona intestinalis TaxID=7719 RepID=UPI000180BCE8|nr:trafficking protein particle complex subunit 8-like [Ciona intestinalis]|eukprot:XP_002129871.1 trafficking protein particle complex subunit 8-like [Ciona intestinalis]